MNPVGVVVVQLLRSIVVQLRSFRGLVSPVDVA